jgi:signal transduction histidine kinase
VHEQDRALTQAHEQVTEALEQQTATGEILRVIAGSPNDTQPVFEAIVRNAVRLCDGVAGIVWRRDGDWLDLVASHNVSEERQARARSTGQRRGIDRVLLAGRAILDRVPVSIPDISRDPEYDPELARQTGAHGALSVPMLKDGIPIGAITVRRARVGAFPSKQIALLETFADQAVIAIENVRLFTETKEALEQQTATSEILRVIASSPTDVQPVFDTIVTNAARLCGASQTATAVCLARDGFLHLDAVHRVWITPDGLEEYQRLFPLPISPHIARTLRGDTFHIADITHNPAAPEEMKTLARHGGYESMVWVPLVRGDEGLGLLSAVRATPRPFDENQIALLRTFADQAVIAIENVRLFTELEQKNEALTQAHAQVTEALDQQTATAEILRVISRSPTDVKPVFDIVADRAVRLCEADQAIVVTFDGELVHLAALANFDAPGVEAMRRMYPRPPDLGFTAGRVVLTGVVVHLPSILDDPRYTYPQLAHAAGFRSGLGVPMLRDAAVIGAVAVGRFTRGPFSERQIALLQTFADQAVIAIENVRLFKELEHKTRELEAASQHKSEFLANMSHELRTPLNAIIGYSELLEEEAADLDGARLVPDLQKIATAAKHQLSLINDILDLSKVEAGRMELELAEFDLPSAIENALILVRERAHRRGITLGSTIDERLGVIGGDERKVKQILLNLLSNALKFTPEGGRIDVRAGVEDAVVEVSVTDTGLGVAPEDQAAVFEEFRQVGAADKKVEGTGLGLALCRRFVELHGGRIWVKSQVGQGSAFTFTLPVRREG